MFFRYDNNDNHESIIFDGYLRDYSLTKKDLIMDMDMDN